MTRRRWIADEVSGNLAVLTGDHADHLVRVLRARLGQEFDVVTGSVVRVGRVASIAEGRVEFDLGEELPAPAAVALTLLLSIFKFDRMEWAIEKATELGVSRVIPIIARRTDAHLGSAATKRADRWRKIALQAAEQSRRATPPEITNPVKLREAVNRPAGLKVVLAESEKNLPLRDAIAPGKVDGETLLAVGPEGGWTEDELGSFRKEGWKFAWLGPTILRAETAAIAAVAVTFSQFDR